MLWLYPSMLSSVIPFYIYVLLHTVPIMFFWVLTILHCTTSIQFTVFILLYWTFTHNSSMLHMLDVIYVLAVY
jgi:hypothetical protein